MAAEAVGHTVHKLRHSVEEADMEHSVVDNDHIDAEADVGDAEEATTMGTEYDMVVVVVQHVSDDVSDALAGVGALGSGEAADVEGGGGLPGGDVGAEAVARMDGGVVVEEVDSQGQTAGAEGRWLWNVYRTSWTGPRAPEQDRSPIPQYLSEAG